MTLRTDRNMTGAERDAVLVVLDACRCFPGRWLYTRELLPPLADRGAGARALYRASRRRDFPGEALEVAGVNGSMVRSRGE